MGGLAEGCVTLVAGRLMTPSTVTIVSVAAPNSSLMLLMADVNREGPAGD